MKLCYNIIVSKTIVSILFFYVFDGQFTESWFQMSHDHKKDPVSYLSIPRELITIGVPVLVAVIGLIVVGYDVRSGGVLLMAAGVLGALSGLFLHLLPAINKEVKALERPVFAILGLALLVGALFIFLLGLAAFS